MSIPLGLTKKEAYKTYPYSPTNKELILAAGPPWQRKLVGGITEPSACDLNTSVYLFHILHFACR